MLEGMYKFQKAACACLAFITMISMFSGTASAAAEYGEPVAPYAVLLMDADSRQILFGQHIDDEIEPASTTKIMTCILALENSSPDDEVVISEKAAGTAGSSLKLVTNEKVKMGDLLSGMMMISGNDAAVAVAEHIGGSVSGFADMMNAKAQELGMANSHFLTPHGMHTDEGDHHTTARDMAALTLYALKNPQFAQIVNKSSYTMPKDNKKQKDTVKNTNKLLSEDGGYYYQYATGVKTGSTPAAGDCLVASASKDGMNLVCLVFKDETKEGTDRWSVTKKLFEWGFENKKTIDIAPLLGTQPVQVQVENYADGDPGGGLLELETAVGGAVYVTLDKAVAEGLQGGADSLAAATTYKEQPPLQAPVEKGAALGTVVYTSKATGEEIFSCDLVASRGVLKKEKLSEESVDVIATLPPKPQANKPGQSDVEIWYWLIVPSALIIFLAFRLFMKKRSKRVRTHIKTRYTYRIK